MIARVKRASIFDRLMDMVHGRVLSTVDIFPCALQRSPSLMPSGSRALPRRSSTAGAPLTGTHAINIYIVCDIALRWVPRGRVRRSHGVFNFL